MSAEIISHTNSFDAPFQAPPSPSQAPSSPTFKTRPTKSGGVLFIAGTVSFDFGLQIQSVCADQNPIRRINPRRRKKRNTADCDAAACSPASLQKHKDQKKRVGVLFCNGDTFEKSVSQCLSAHDLKVLIAQHTGERPGALYLLNGMEGAGLRQRQKGIA